VLDADSRFLGIAQDRLEADQDDPVERFKHLIWEIGMCNAFYGLYRLSVLRKMSIWEKSKNLLFGDNLALAEVALLGKIVQIDAPLFIRRLTRNYNYKSYDERNTQLMSEVEPRMLKEGISFPHSRLAYATVELLNGADLTDDDKEALMKETIRCFRTKFGPQMIYEIDRAIALMNKGIYYHQWNESDCIKIRNGNFRTLNDFHKAGLLKRLQEARFFFPERKDLTAVYLKCHNELNGTHSLAS
jgi:hypothetical protein